MRSSACDGWQPIEREWRLTRRCCELLLEHGFEVHILTKSGLVLRDLDLFAGRKVQVGVTVTSLDPPRGVGDILSDADRADVVRRPNVRLNSAAALSENRYMRNVVRLRFPAVRHLVRAALVGPFVASESRGTNTPPYPSSGLLKLTHCYTFASNETRRTRTPSSQSPANSADSSSTSDSNAKSSPVSLSTPYSSTTDGRATTDAAAAAYTASTARSRARGVAAAGRTPMFRRGA